MDYVGWYLLPRDIYYRDHIEIGYMVILRKTLTEYTVCDQP